MKMPIKCTWVSSYWAICRTRISALFALRLKSAKTRATPPQSLRFNSIGNRKMSPNIETKCYLNLRQKCHPNLSPHDRTAQGFSAPWKGRVDPVEEDIPPGNCCSSRKQSERGGLVTVRHGAFDVKGPARLDQRARSL